MHHDYQLAARGECSCSCHYGSGVCSCGIPKSVRAWFCPAKPAVKSRKPRRVNLESRVRPFQRRHIAQRGATYSKPYRLPMSATRQLSLVGR